LEELIADISSGDDDLDDRSGERFEKMLQAIND
jgi:CRISPR/Cas system CSM-associated protein Csm2 small subunit